MKEIFRLQLGEYKRRLSNSRPYHKIMDEREIRRLKTQVLASRIRMLNGRPVRRHTHLLSRSYPTHPRDYFAALALKDYENYEAKRMRMGRDSAFLDDDESLDSRLLAINTHRGMDSNFRQQISSNDISAANLLQVSLKTLKDRSRPKRRQRRKKGFHAREEMPPSEYIEEAFPSEGFLSGSLWLGKNLVVIVDQLYEDVVATKADITADLELSIDDGNRELTEEVVEIIRHGLQHIVDVAFSCTKRVKKHLNVREYSLNIGNVYSILHCWSQGTHGNFTSFRISCLWSVSRTSPTHRRHSSGTAPTPVLGRCQVVQS